jgi:hypothetical protein
MRKLRFTFVPLTVSVVSVSLLGGLPLASLPTSIAGEEVVDVVTLDLSGISSRVEIVALDAQSNDEAAIALSDSRVVHVRADGDRSLTQLRRSKGAPARVLLAGPNRWNIEPPTATLVDATGKEIRTLAVPPFTTTVTALEEGGLAFLTPGAPHLVTVMNRFGLVVGAFGEPLRRGGINAAQERFLNEGTIVENRSGELLVVFAHQPHPTIRRYGRSGEFLGETVLRGQYLDMVAEDAEQRLGQIIDSDCAGGRVTVFGAAYDRTTDTLWLATAIDDGVGAVRVLSGDLDPIGQLHLMSTTSTAPIVPRHLAFGGRYLFWASEGTAWRADVSRIRRDIAPFARRLASLTRGVGGQVLAQSVCGPAQTMSPNCSYVCPAGANVTCTVSEPGPGWVLEEQWCSQPPQTPNDFKGCEKGGTWCEQSTQVRETRIDRVQCPPTDADGDGYSEESGDCNDSMYCANPGAWAHAGTYCDVGACDHWDDDCNGVDDATQCSGSPIVIDVARNGFGLTSASEGVYFDLDADGTPEHWSWTAANSDDAWLALDRNGNGTIDNGQELFGNFSPQPASGHRNGYIALAVFDLIASGGNEDGQIDARDAVFSRLRLWRDINHNGLSEYGELESLPARGVIALDLNYRASRRVDQYGNRFAYTSRVTGLVGRWSFDVFLVCDR